MNPQAPNYETSNFYAGVGDDDDIVAPELQKAVSQKLKDKVQGVEALVKARELKAKPPRDVKGAGK